MIHKHVLFTGLMGSGKSTFLKEYIINHKVEEFTKPNVEAKFQGLDFQFIDNVFAIKLGNNTMVNYYELDAPTIKKWTQFISSANAIIVVYNNMPKAEYGSHKELKNNIIQNSKKSVPLLFVINNFKNKEKALKSFQEQYEIETLKDRNYELIFNEASEKYFDDDYGYRVKIDDYTVKKVVEWPLNKI